MSDEEKNSNEEPQADGAEAQAEGDAPAAEEAPAEEAAPEAAEEAPAEEAAEDAPAEEAAPEEPAAEAEAPAAGAAEPSGDGDEEAAEPLTPKAIRKRKRSEHKGEARPPRSTEERAAERAAERRRKAEQRRRRRAKARQARTPGSRTPPAERAPGSKKVRQGTVVSDKADKTITVRVEVVRRHPVYEKVIRRSTTIHAHDERNDAGVGDTVRVIESRPLSRTKRWRLVEVLERAK